MMKKAINLILLVILAHFTSCSLNDNESIDVDLKNSEWNFVAFNLGDEWTERLEDTTVTLRFNSNNTIEGEAGCNSFSGAYISSGNSIRFNITGATLINCEDEINNQETEYLNGIRRARVVAIDQNNLELRITRNTSLVFRRMLEN
ncbi:META domain-containing protein [Flavobacteriaceae bacterium R38]|nr:META domain-containing protein [Flavobacteriaceae bacterium R38]